MPTGRHVGAGPWLEGSARSPQPPWLQRVTSLAAPDLAGTIAALPAVVDQAMPDVDDLYRVLVHAARESMIVTDQEGAIAFANDAAARWTARSDDRRAQRTVFDILHLDDGAVMRAAFERCRTGHEAPVFVECRVRQGDGRWIPADVQVRSIEGRDGARRVLLQIRDISENLAMRARLSQAHRLASLGRLTTGVADDLARVMATIRSQLDHLLLHEAMPFGMRVIRRAAETGTALAQQLRAFADAAPASRRSIDVHDLLKDIRRSISPVLWLDVLLTAGSTTVRADHETLRQGLTDLILGFANAMPDESIVSVATRNEPLAQHSGRTTEASGVDYLVIEVSNTAEAVRGSLNGEVFEPRTSLPVSAAIMLALVILDEVSFDSGGFVEVSTNPNGATVVTTYLVVE
jgi:two-component system NtrC family sensor kinase